MGLAKNAVEVICKLLEKNENISKLILIGNQIGDEGAQILKRAILKSKTLISIDLTSNEITAVGGGLIISSLIYNQSIVDLNLSSLEGLHRNTLGSKGVQQLQTVLSFNKFLTILNVSGNFIGNQGLQHICDGLAEGENETLQWLDISLNNITSQGCQMIYNTLSKTKLKHLDLSRNPLKNSGIKIIGNTLSNGGILLDSLIISDCQYNYLGATYIYQGLKRNSKIKKLIMDKNNLKGKTLFELTSMLYTNSSLQKLSFEDCNLGDFGISYLMDGLERNNTLKYLNLKQNRIQLNGAIQIASLIQKGANALHHLDLSSNPLRNQGAQYIAKALIDNKSLAFVEMRDTEIQDDGAKEITYSLKVNTSLKHFNVDCNMFSPAYLKQIQKLTKQNKAAAKQSKCPSQQREIKVLTVQNRETKTIQKHIKELSGEKIKVFDRYQQLEQKFEEVLIQEKVKYDEIKIVSDELQQQINIIDQDLELLEHKILQLSVEYQKKAKIEQQRIMRITKELDLSIKESKDFDQLIFNIVQEKKNDLSIIKYENYEEKMKWVNLLQELMQKEKVAEMSYRTLEQEKGKLLELEQQQKIPLIQQRSIKQEQTIEQEKVQQQPKINKLNKKKKKKGL